MSRFGKSIVITGWILVLASCATPDPNHPTTQRPQAGAATTGPADGGGGGGGAGGGY